MFRSSCCQLRRLLRIACHITIPTGKRAREKLTGRMLRTLDRICGAAALAHPKAERLASEARAKQEAATEAVPLATALAGEQGVTVQSTEPFTWFDILVPGVSTWEPLATALGVVAFWALVAVSSSFYLKKRIGQAAWRSIHYMSFGAFAAALAHGIIAGTDTLNPWVAGGYAAAAVSIVLLTVIRIVSAGAGPRPTKSPFR